MKIRATFIVVMSLLLLSSCNSARNNNVSNTTKEYKIKGAIKGLNDGFFVTGKIIGVDSGTIIIYQQDTITLENNTFTYKGKLEGATNQYFRVNDKYYFSLLLANETFKVTVDVSKADDRGNINDIEIVGSAINDEFKKVNDVVRNTPEAKKLNKLFEVGKTLKKGTDTYKLNYGALSDAREASRKVQAAYIKNYALNNPNSVVAAYYMRFQANEVDQTFEEYKKIVEGFSDAVKKSSFYKPLKDKLEGLKRTAIGEIAPDFMLKTDKGEDFTLSSLRGEKIVLVDFWASWCLPCRKSYPHLKKVYKKYKNKGFEVVAVTNDSNHDQWKKAITEDGLEWIQVADVFPPRGSEVMTAKVITAYAAPYLPSTYLLDREGKTLAKHLQGEALDRKLEEIFGF
ncbi:TlpA disulfide reductase family protein [Flavivirga sp. 57AJ16]|uniref:TlpA disulfide reductase family protein n=1 Tax=Flavivirga sp. 57AJ16 TaxID=3025307 RepID=UPI0023655943|nr:TlpA disulfide reductase family protein [Flavivirga sp. 57AJ16]MDD7888016.1 TlpA disulfide reductase family protein [Flavivirga sp. 57AJ16]